MLPSNRLGDVESPSVQWGRRFVISLFGLFSCSIFKNGRSFVCLGSLGMKCPWSSQWPGLGIAVW